ncbi:MAG: alpha-D-ribose 1-methylphosphonate 5-triphosphate diphosphatase [Gemmobacter sp.]
MTETILTNARILAEGAEFDGTLILQGATIRAVERGRSHAPGAIDCGGDFLCPGLVELHTDNLERHLSPRPGVDWPHRSAILAHDAELAGTGITTVFDALRVGSIVSDERSRYGRYARPMADEILGMRAEGAFRISHFIHLRAEVCSETLEAELDEFGTEDRVGILSLMDHTPGQRQFTDLTQLKRYLRGKYSMTEEEIAAHIGRQRDLGARVRDRHEGAAVAAAGRYGATLASHDDTTPEHVARSAAHGVRLAEFPTTRAAAEACRAHGIAVMMGAPNLIRGGSHSGNVAAEELAQAGLLDAFSSDYVPAALLQAAVRLAPIAGGMAGAIATVTAAPAAAAGLADRGRLAPGLRADLLRFGLTLGAPRVVETWVQGRRVA